MSSKKQRRRLCIGVFGILFAQLAVETLHVSYRSQDRWHQRDKNSEDFGLTLAPPRRPPSFIAGFAYTSIF